MCAQSIAEFGRLSHEFIEKLKELHKSQLCWWRVQSEDQLNTWTVCLSQLLEKRQKADSGADKSAELKPRDGTQTAMFYHVACTQDTGLFYNVACTQDTGLFYHLRPAQ